MDTTAIRTVVCVAAMSGLSALAQPTSDSPLAPRPNGPRHADPTYHVLVNATIHPSPGETIEGGSIAIRNGRIVNVGADAGDYPGARVWDCEGLHVYPGLIEPYFEVTTPAPEGDPATMHWSPNVTPQRFATDGEGIASRDAEALRKLGFVAAAISPQGGIFRGQSGVVSLASDFDDDSLGERPIYAEGVYQSVALSAGRGFGGGYPNSQMGAIAMIRQTLSDALWQVTARDAGEQIAPNSLDALIGADSQGLATLVFETRDELEAIRAAKIAREFDAPAIILGNGSEYKRLDAIVEDGLPIILPINFPEEPTVDTIGAEDDVELATLMSWEHAPYNPRRLDEAGMTVALTTSGQRNRSEFMDGVRSAIERGLDEDHALAMMTTTPAELLGIDADLGSIEAGKIASIIVTDGPIFEKKTKVRDVWIDGRRHEINTRPEDDITGKWQVAFGEMEGPVIVIAGGNKITLEEEGKEPIKARNVKRSGNTITYVVDEPEEGTSVLVTGVISGEEMVGLLRTADALDMAWTATRIEKGKGDDGDEEGQDEAAPADPIVGHWDLMAHNEDMFGPDGVPFSLDITREDDKFDVQFTTEPVAAEAVEVTFEDGLLEVRLDDAENQDQYQLSVVVTGDTMTGTSVVGSTGAVMDVAGTRDQPGEEVAENEEASEDLKNMPGLPGYPFGPYAVPELPPQRTVAFTNATVWTSGPDGLIENGWVVVEGGKILAVGSGPMDVMTSVELEIVDCQGMHITPGIIDCHSHTGISRGVNESGQAVTAEVRIQDVTDPDSINWYRQLAGGVTSVSNLHGSANPIGGQSQTNKIRWGVAHPDDMHMEGAIPGIKFALGENVKQSNWSNAGDRYPQTRMGVETLIRDRFIAAREYAEQMKHYGDPGATASARGVDANPTIVASTDARQIAPRRDLELEALAEILAGERLVHCHSYRQDEILMLCAVAEEFDFQIGTFQHVLEGYKVAEAIKEHARGGSCFSDWWAYKVEVQDAIPYNGAIMHDVGVVVSFNSDSDELARRLNTEAAKAVRYGGVEPAEALKFVTINPAIQLGVEDRVGSIEPGKDADLAIWSGDPLSTLSRCMATWVDGREYFSTERDAELRAWNAAERKRLVQKILADDKPKSKGDSAEGDAPSRESPGGRRPPQERMTVEEWRIAQTLEAIRRHNIDLIERGIEPAAHDCGDCGTSLSDLFANDH